MNDRDNGDNAQGELKEAEFKRLLGPLYQDGGMVERKACPYCGTTDRLVEIFQEYMVFRKKAAPGVPVGSRREQIVFMDPRFPPLVGSKVPSLAVDYDVCRRCGAEYPVRICRKDAIAGPPPQGAEQFGSQHPGTGGKR